MDWSMIPGLVPAVVSLVSAFSNMPVTKAEVQARLRELQAQTLPEFSEAHKQFLQDLANAPVAPESSER